MLYVIMPAYNEEEIISETIKQWHQVVEKVGNDSRLAIFNDGSTDRTYEIVLQLKQNYPQLLCIDKPNTGHGPTCTFAYKYCIDAGAEYIFQTDSDGQTSPDEFWQLWEKRLSYDFLFGYRKKRGDGFVRLVASKILKFFVWAIFKENVKDPNSPFKLIKTSRLVPIIKNIPDSFFLSNVIISTLAVKRRERLLWLPISFKSRQSGVNSVKVLGIVKIGIKAVFDLYEIRNKV